MKRALKVLERMVRDAQMSLGVRPAISRSLILALQCLGLGLPAAERLADSKLSQSFSSLLDYEVEWYRELEQLGALECLPRLRQERADRIAATVLRYLGQPGTLLDIGCGDGLIAVNLAQAGYPVSTCDLVDWRVDRTLEFERSVSGHVPYHGRTFDKGTLLMVAHHASNPDQLIQEVFAKCREVYIIESVTNNDKEFLCGTWFDWWYNNVLGRLKRGRIPVPCYFHTHDEWVNYIYRLTNCWPETSVDLLVDEFLNPEHHVLYKYIVRD